jgi:hypothetical protein
MGRYWTDKRWHPAPSAHVNLQVGGSGSWKTLVHGAADYDGFVYFDDQPLKGHLYRLSAGRITTKAVSVTVYGGGGNGGGGGGGGNGGGGGPVVCPQPGPIDFQEIFVGGGLYIGNPSGCQMGYQVTAHVSCHWGGSLVQDYGYVTSQTRYLAPNTPMPDVPNAAVRSLFSSQSQDCNYISGGSSSLWGENPSVDAVVYIRP